MGIFCKMNNINVRDIERCLNSIGKKSFKIYILITWISGVFDINQNNGHKICYMALSPE